MEVGALKKGAWDQIGFPKNVWMDNDSYVISEGVSVPKLPCCLMLMGAEREAEAGSNWRSEEVAAKVSRKRYLDWCSLLAVALSSFYSPLLSMGNIAEPYCANGSAQTSASGGWLSDVVRRGPNVRECCMHNDVEPQICCTWVFKLVQA